MEDIIKMDLKGLVYADLDWIYLPVDKDQWRAVVNSLMHLRVP